MKATIDKKELEAGLAVVNRVIPRKGPIPSINNVLIKTDGNLLTLAGTNLETSITTSVAAQISEEGSAVIPAQLFFDYLKTRGDGNIVLESGSVESQMVVRQGRSKATMNGVAVREYPPLPQVQEDATFTVEKAAFRDLIAQVVFAVAREESRPVLMGCEMRVNGEDLVLAAADGFRMAVSKGVTASAKPDEVRAIIPKGGMVELQRLLRGDGNANITVNSQDNSSQGRLFFDVEQGAGVGIKTRLVCQLIHGTFPVYESLIPKEYKTRVVFSAVDLQRAVKTASIIARENSHILRLVIGKESGSATMSVDSRSGEIGYTSAAIDLVEVDGEEENRVAVNARYLSDVMPMLRGNATATMEFVDAQGPVVFRWPDSDDYVYVLMPMAINWLNTNLGEILDG